MNKRDTSSTLVAMRVNATNGVGPARGILRLAPDLDIEHRRVAPPTELAPFIAHVWSIRWNLAAPFTTETLPHPSVHIVLEEQEDDAHAWRAEVAGVHRHRFVRELHGRGRVFGIKFRPACFQPFLRGSVTRLTNRVVPVSDVLGARADAWTRALRSESDVDARISITTEFLRPLLPRLTREIRETRDLVERMATDRSLLNVDDAARAIALDVRALQRRFHQFVGASPKWVLQRYRLHEAAEQLKAPRPPSLAELAASLGYADQSHFARDFKRTIGRTPKAFARSIRAPM